MKMFLSLENKINEKKLLFYILLRNKYICGQVLSEKKPFPNYLNLEMVL
jgi:hypothetical protein